jgi:hypothetical protein
VVVVCLLFSAKEQFFARYIADITRQRTRSEIIRRQNKFSSRGIRIFRRFIVTKIVVKKVLKVFVMFQTNLQS